MKIDQQMAAPQRRRKVVVDVQTQRVLAMRMVFHCMLFTVVGGISVTVNEYMTNSAMNLQLLQESVTRNFISYSCTILALLPLLIYDSMKLSNRIVGPICRLRDSMRKIASNEQVDRLNFRVRDYWQEVPGEFNAMVDRLRSDVADAREADLSESELPAAFSVR
ncbi:MAG: hypothetical protein ABL921_16050 [Pirellula sp.]